MSRIITSFPVIVADGKTYSFLHLKPASIHLAGKLAGSPGIDIRVSYQSHVFTRLHDGDPASQVVKDEAGRLRQFCHERYERSKTLPQFCRDMILQDFLTWESLDRNRASNLAVAGHGLHSGLVDLVIYYLFPSRSGRHDVELVVKSAYRKEIDFSRIKRRYTVSQLIRKAHFQKTRVP